MSPAFIDLDKIASTPSSSESNTLAEPSNEVPSFPVIFATAPSFARFP